jgi:hypothetical protein
VSDKMEKLLAELSKPFPPHAVSWKPGHAKGDKCMALAYADLRAYQDRLDEIFGIDWSCRYVPWEGNRIICELTIYVGDALGRREAIVRSSTGEADAQDEKNNMAGSVSEAMAFKRACAMFGLGRYLYDLPNAWVEFDTQSKRISKAGQDELDNRYRTWYKKTMAALAKPAARTVDTATGEIDFGMGEGKQNEANNPTEVALKIIRGWKNRTEAEMFAVNMGAFANEEEAKASLDRVIAKHGGKVTGENYLSIYLDYLNACQEKIDSKEQPQPELLAA